MKKIYFACFLFFFAPSLFAQSLDLIYKNNKGSRSFKNDKKMEAYEEFLGALTLDPYNPLVQFNLGSTLSGLGEEEKAEKLYLQLLKDVDTHLQKDLPSNIQQQWLKVKFAILYNLGVHYQLAKNVEQALEYYQKGLELLPDSKEIKTNIELMLTSGGGGKGKSDQKQKDEKGEGKGESEGENEQDKKEDQKPSDGDRTNKKQKGKEFDQSQLSTEDLKRIMDELKQQEQGIRSKVQRKGDKSEPKEKQW
ncbi:tetratricopeptide repeat protein [bacterium]|nr:tetratricopeptide repeat protein [bacterium]